MRISTKKVIVFGVLSLFVNAAVSTGAEAGGKAELPPLPQAAAETAAPQGGTGTAAPIETSGAKKVDVTDSSFRCLHQMTKVGSMYVDNLLGDLDGTLAVAKSANGGTYPPGSVVQLFPKEAMVKLEKGANPETNDWEFFMLEVSAEGSKIKERGFGPEKPRNMFGSCFSCHAKGKDAAPQADMICAAGHPCPPINFPGGINTAALIPALQKTDARCPSPEPLTDAEKAELGTLKKVLEAAAQAAASAGGQR